MRRLGQLLFGAFIALCVWAGSAEQAEASHYRGGNIYYENLGPLGGTSADRTWIVIKATLIIYQRRSAHCNSPTDGRGSCCAGSCVATPPRQLSVGGTFTWGAGGKAVPTGFPQYTPSPTAASYTANPFTVIDEDKQQDALGLRYIAYRIYPPTTATTTVKWGSCCWIGGTRPNGNGSFEVVATVQVASGNQDPQFNSPLLLNACRGQAFTHNLNPSDPDRDRVEVILTPTSGGADAQNPGLTVTKAGILNWSAPVAGTWDVKVTAYDLLANGTRKGASTVRDFLINVSNTCANIPPTITVLPARATVAPGSPACTNVRVADADQAQRLTIRVNPTKTGVVLTPATALAPNQSNPFTFRYCWTPTGADEGTSHNILFTVQDNGTPVLSAQKTFVVTVTAGVAPTITITPSGNSKTVDENKCIKFKAKAADRDGPIKSFNVTKPAFCTAKRLSADEFEIECCPKYDDDGDHANGSKTYDIEFEVEDRDGTPKKVKKTVKVKVNDVNRPPNVTDPGPQTIDEKKPFKLNIKATDPDGDKLNYSMTGLPPGAKIDPNTGEIDWTPTDKDIGDHTATVTVTDGNGGKTEIKIKFTVTDVNDPPVITSTAPTVAYVGEDIAYDAKATDPDAKDKLTWSLKKGPAGASIDPATGKLSWTPSKSDAGKTVEFEIEVCDNGTPQACTTQKFKVKVDLKCNVDEDCPSDQICITSPNGGPKVCVDPGCATQSPKCRANDFCKEGKCGTNPCDNKTCGNDEYCNPFTGDCVKPCASVTCPAGEKCLWGTCTKDPCATAGANGGPCAADETCDDSDPQAPKCVKNPCGTKSCRHGRVCLEDACIDDPCANISCPDPTAQRCVAGQCIDRKPCAVDVDCDGDEVCLGKKCFPPACYTAKPQCPGSDEQCLGAKCTKDECGNGNKKCGNDEACRPYDNKCIKSCATVTCKSGEKCVDGACTKDPCAGVKCSAGEVCIPDGNGAGACEKDNCSASNVCRHGRICRASANTCDDDPCAGLKCPGKSQCKDGQCVPPDQCQFDADCPGEFLCVAGKCVKPDCKANGDCPSGQLCQDGICKEDPCKDKTCPDGQICKAGTCVGSCAGVFCAEGEKCLDGKCTKDPCASVKCGSGKICQNGTCVEDGCQKQQSPCKQGRVCKVDKCVDDPCGSLKCPTDQTCQEGQCTGEKPCKTDSDCPEGGVCIDGKCGPAACYKETCEGSKICLKGKCGDNACDGKTCEKGEFCKPTDGSCAKSCPTCKDGEICKSGSCTADPCKDKTCGDGERCVDGNCVKDICAEKDANTKYCRYGRVCQTNACEDDPCANVKCGDGETCKDGVCVGPPVTPEPSNEVAFEPADEVPVIDINVDGGNNDVSKREFSAAGGLGCLGCTTGQVPFGTSFFFFGLFFLLFVGITRRKSA